jgi:CYTH domain-containing protein
MPIENERKYILLDDDGQLETQLAKLPGIARSVLRQAYLDGSGVRIRAIAKGDAVRHVFTFKRPVEGRMVEIETDIAAADFARLWTLRRETLSKVRYSWEDGRFHWDVDFFKTDEGTTYFALAEVEMPEDETVPPSAPPPLARHVLGLAPLGDPRFTSKRLADQVHAERLLSDIRRSGKVE